MSEKRITFVGDLNNKDVKEFLDNAGATIKDNDNNYDLISRYDENIMNGGVKGDEYSEPTFREDVADVDVDVEEVSEPIVKPDKPKPKVIVEKSEPKTEYLEEDHDKDLVYEDDIEGDPDIKSYDYKTSIQKCPLDIWALIDTYFRDNPYHKTRHQLDSYDELLYSECREILNCNVFDMDCDEYALKYIGSNYYLVQLDPMLIKNQKKIDDAKRILIKDVNGQNVEILPNEFLTHINRYHTRKISIHKERGYAFKVDKDLRALLKKNTNN